MWVYVLHRIKQPYLLVQIEMGVRKARPSVLTLPDCLYFSVD